MVRLAREVSVHIVSEFGPEEMLRRLSDPFWFQAFGCVLGFDWHSSGVTTTVTGAVKEGILLKTYERAPEDFETLLGMEGVGARTLRALALTAEVIYGTPASTRDPARFSFTHGGKDGCPFPVDCDTYDHTVDVLRSAVSRAGIGRSERVQALKRLVRFGEEQVRARMQQPSSSEIAGEGN